jgi:hypothetical protein
MSEDLKALFPGQEVVAGGETIVVSPFAFGQLPQVAKCFASIKGVIEGGDLVEIASAGGEDLLKLLCLAAKKPRVWFDTLPSDEGLNLMAAVIQENRDFFVRRMSPALQRLTQAVNGTGAPSSPDSSEAATDGATSQATP